MKIPITKPWFDNKELQAVQEPLKSGWVVQGPKVATFEKKIAQFTKVKYAKATTSCTTALHLALIATGIGQGDEVIVPSFTYIASVNAVEYVGATPIFVDIDLNTFNIDPAKIEEKVTKKTKAIMPVHLFGLCADMRPILKIARQYKLKVIEDAACAIGGFYYKKHAGAMGDAGCLSFHPRKSITCGEGGMILTNSKKIANMVNALRDHGASKSDLQRHKKAGYLLPDFNIRGYNYRMTDIQGAIGIEQVKKLFQILKKKKALAKKLYSSLKQFPWLKPPIVLKNYIHGYQAFVCLFWPESPFNKSGGLNIGKLSSLYQKRNKFMDRLEKVGIAARPGTHAVHTTNYYKKKYNIALTDFPNALVADRLSVALPFYPQMTNKEFNYLITNIKNVWNHW
ncbi:DegT/DnrJ/EryC1/StrS family aminotransferase [Patescibacteria group bacterium AH-259-L05]|nr:DegT/DnrJ/EryC1/StrS family aminotransferase [Patescibacteria group bacterium AH-259-L05]